MLGRRQEELDFEGDDDEEAAEPEAHKTENKSSDPSATSATPSRDTSELHVVAPWISPPETEAKARVRLSLYFALCVKSQPMLSGLVEAYVTASDAARAGLMAELPLLVKAAAKGFGESSVVSLISGSPEGSHPMVLAILDLLVPWETNKPSQELVAAVRRLRETRVARRAAGSTNGDTGGAAGDKVRAAAPLV